MAFNFKVIAAILCVLCAASEMNACEMLEEQTRVVRSVDDLEGGVVKGEVKREVKNMKQRMVEVAIYADSSFVREMAMTKGIRGDALKQWISDKWDAIHKLFQGRVGLAVKVKSIELWKDDPDYYTKVLNNPNSGSGSAMHAMCSNTPGPKYDHKMLYTMASIEIYKRAGMQKGVCQTGRKRNCAMVKSLDDSIAHELHAFGHNLGLEHLTCGGGFMNMRVDNTVFPDCYRAPLQMIFQRASTECLETVNVPPSV